jgi:GNAT superfamily N-acetyltransferase
MASTFNDAVALLKRRPMQRVQGLEMLRQKTADVLALRSDGLLLRERSDGLHFLYADTNRAVEALLKQLPPCDALVCDRTQMDSFLMAKLGFTVHQACINVVYEHKRPIDIRTELRLMPLSPSDAGMISRHYELHSAEEIAEYIRKERLLGGYLGNTLVGFIGWHPEGDMGLLHVFEAYRRQGFAYAMEALQINLMLKRGELPRGQVIRGNEASLALQVKLGFTVADSTVSWMFR